MIRLLLFVTAVGLASAVAHSEPRFLQTLDDIPLAPGLQERAAAGFDFATPEGRISEVEAAGAGDEDAVRAYYRAALPALGWALAEDQARMEFIRGRDRLQVSFGQGSDGSLEVRYRVISRPASMALD